MFVMTWNHTRTGKPMKATASSKGTLLIRAMMIRAIFPSHPIFLNDQPI